MSRTATIRRAEPSDLPALAELHDEAVAWLASMGLRQWQPGAPRARTARGVPAAVTKGTCYVAEANGELVGTVTIDDYADSEFWTAHERAEPALYLHRMIVARSHAGHDLGRALLDFADDLASSRRVRWLRLDAWKDNTALHAYYLRQGFEHVRTVDLPHRGSGALFQRPVRGGRALPGHGSGSESVADGQSGRARPRSQRAPKAWQRPVRRGRLPAAPGHPVGCRNRIVGTTARRA